MPNHSGRLPTCPPAGGLDLLQRICLCLAILPMTHSSLVGCIPLFYSGLAPHWFSVLTKSLLSTSRLLRLPAGRQVQQYQYQQLCSSLYLPACPRLPAGRCRQAGRQAGIPLFYSGLAPHWFSVLTKSLLPASLPACPAGRQAGIPLVTPACPASPAGRRLAGKTNTTVRLGKASTGAGSHSSNSCNPPAGLPVGRQAGR
jgi:hypothetical protein